MVKEWLAAAIGSLMIAGSSTGAAINRENRQPDRERPASTTRLVTTADVMCVGAAVQARETSLSAAAATQAAATADAYKTRATALASAYSGSDPKAVRENVRKSWDAFKTSTKNAKATWQRSKDNAWKTFRESVKSCKGATEISDASNSSAEVNVQ